MKRKGLKTLVIGILILLIGAVVIPLIVVFTLLLDDQNHGQRFVIPGTAKIHIERPGQYYLWNDFRTVYNGKTYNQSPAIPDGLTINVTNEGGDTLEFTDSMAMNANFGGSSKNSIGFINVATPGTITIAVEGISTERVFSVSAFSLKRFFSTLFLCIVCSLGGVLLIIFGIIRLCKNKHSHAATDLQYDSADR